MSLAPGTRIGQLEIVGRIGAGGMGEVFRAHDTALRRDVAVKILPPDFLNDLERRQRFAREAQLLAAISHPHIAQVYGIEESPAGPAILMELVPGDTLRHLLGGRALPLRDAVGYARQIALALDAAHEKGIVHRDLKPANIAITPDGTVKVLDFGLAKILADAAVGGASQTVASGQTREGELVGTPAYMSPEQLRGQPVDRRSDIWSFGCVLFEMLTGRQAFTGPSVSDTVAGILERDPDWTLLPPSAPRHLRHLVERCLAKDRRLRLRDIGDALPELDEESNHRLTAAAASQPAVRWRAVVYGLAALAAALTVTAAAWLWSRPAPAPAAEAQTVRFTMPAPAGLRFGSSMSTIETVTLAFSPEGTRLAFIATGADGVSRIVIRSLDSEEVRPAGSERAHSAFWSPDGRSLAFFAAGKLKRVDQSGGAAIVICDVSTASGLTGSWGSNGDILFASVNGDGIYRVPANGGARAIVVPTTADRPRVLWPHFLPDGKRFLYSWLGANLRGGIVLVDLDGEQRQMLEARSRAQFVQPDILLSVREGTLLAHRVDVTSARVVSDPVPVLAPINYSSATGWSEFSASSHGTLAVRTRSDDAALTFIGGDGKVEREVGVRGQYLTVRASPDESSILYGLWRPELGTYAVWRMSLDRYAATRITASPVMETAEVWVPGMREIVLSISDGVAPNLHLRDLATGVDRRLAQSEQFQVATDISATGQVVYQQRTALGTWDLMQLSLDDPSKPKPLMVTDNSEAGLRFAPRGDRIAFTSDESGRSEVYIAPFPFKGDKIQASTEGGRAPRWQRDGQALYFLSGQRLLRVELDEQGRPGRPQLMFETSRWQDYDVLDGGRRFVAIVVRSAGVELPLTVVLNARRLMEGKPPGP